MSDATRGFYNTNRSFYGKTYFETVKHEFTYEIIFGLYDEGGTEGEMGMRWYELGGRSVPRLEVYADAWTALASFSDVVEALAKWDNRDILPAQFELILRTCGFADLTDYGGDMTQVQIEVHGKTYTANWHASGIDVRDADDKFLFSVNDATYFTRQHLETLVTVFFFGRKRGEATIVNDRIVELENQIAEQDLVLDARQAVIFDQEKRIEKLTTAMQEMHSGLATMKNDMIQFLGKGQQ